MNKTDRISDSRLELCWKAAWTSFLVPLSTTLIVCAYFSYIARYYSQSTQVSTAKYVYGGALAVQIIGMILGIIGLWAKSPLAKAVAIIGILLSSIVVFLAFVLLDIVIGGFDVGTSEYA